MRTGNLINLIPRNQVYITAYTQSVFARTPVFYRVSNKRDCYQEKNNNCDRNKLYQRIPTKNSKSRYLRFIIPFSPKNGHDWG